MKSLHLSVSNYSTDINTGNDSRGRFTCRLQRQFKCGARPVVFYIAFVYIQVYNNALY